jgi:hypothetical protein
MTIVKRVFCVGEGSTLTRTAPISPSSLMNAAKTLLLARVKGMQDFLV